MLTALIVAALIQPQPSPAPASPPPTIVRVHSGPVCTTVHNLVVPTAAVLNKNADLFKTIGSEHQKYVDATRVWGLPDEMHNGQVVLAMANIDTAASNLLVHLHEVDLLLRDSYRAYPQGSNPKVDALRQRVQNIVDLQRTIANRWDQFAGSYIDSFGGTVGGQTYSAVSYTPLQPVQFAVPGVNAPPFLPPQDPAARESVAERDPAVDGAPATQAYRLNDLKFESSDAVREDLSGELTAFVPAVLAAVHDCETGR